MKKKHIPEEIIDFYTGKDLRVDHFLIRCARNTELFSHLDKGLVDIGVYKTEYLLSKDLKDYYRAKINELNRQLRIIREESKSERKEKLKAKILELKLEMKNCKKTNKLKYIQLKQRVIDLKRFGFEAYNKERQSEIQEKLMVFGDTLIEDQTTTAQRNREVFAFLESLPSAEIEHLVKADWQEISSPKGYDKFFNISEKKYRSREQYLTAVLNKIKGISVSKREAFESTMLECAEKRAIEEQYKHKMLEERMAELRESVWKWEGGKRYPDVVQEALKKINYSVADLKNIEMLDHARLKTSSYLHSTYSKVISDLNKELKLLQENEM